MLAVRSVRDSGSLGHSAAKQGASSWQGYDQAPTGEHKGTNPFTKEEMVVKAKPAKNVVKVTALKGLKDLV